jgi:hypothetical protein
MKKGFILEDIFKAQHPGLVLLMSCKFKKAVQKPMYSH